MIKGASRIFRFKDRAGDRRPRAGQSSSESLIPKFTLPYSQYDVSLESPLVDKMIICTLDM